MKGDIKYKITDKNVVKLQETEYEIRNWHDCAHCMPNTHTQVFADCVVPKKFLWFHYWKRKIYRAEYAGNGIFFLQTNFKPSGFRVVSWALA